MSPNRTFPLLVLGVAPPLLLPLEAGCWHHGRQQVGKATGRCLLPRSHAHLTHRSAPRSRLVRKWSGSGWEKARLSVLWGSVRRQRGQLLFSGRQRSFSSRLIGVSKRGDSVPQRHPQRFRLSRRLAAVSIGANAWSSNKQSYLSREASRAGENQPVIPQKRVARAGRAAWRPPGSKAVSSFQKVWRPTSSR